MTVKFPSPNFSSFYFTWSEDFSVNVMKYMHISLRENRLTLKYFAGWPYDLELSKKGQFIRAIYTYEERFTDQLA